MPVNVAYVRSGESGPTGASTSARKPSAGQGARLGVEVVHERQLPDRRRRCAARPVAGVVKSIGTPISTCVRGSSPYASSGSRPHDAVPSRHSTLRRRELQLERVALGGVRILDLHRATAIGVVVVGLRDRARRRRAERREREGAREQGATKGPRSRSGFPTFSVHERCSRGLRRPTRRDGGRRESTAHSRNYTRWSRGTMPRAHEDVRTHGSATSEPHPSQQLRVDRDDDRAERHQHRADGGAEHDTPALRARRRRAGWRRCCSPPPTRGSGSSSGRSRGSAR